MVAIGESTLSINQNLNKYGFGMIGLIVGEETVALLKSLKITFINLNRTF
jgi:hypothetical protein